MAHEKSDGLRRWAVPLVGNVSRDDDAFARVFRLQNVSKTEADLRGLGVSAVNASGPAT